MKRLSPIFECDFQVSLFSAGKLQGVAGGIVDMTLRAAWVSGGFLSVLERYFYFNNEYYVVCGIHGAPSTHFNKIVNGDYGMSRFYRVNTGSRVYVSRAVVAAEIANDATVRTLLFKPLSIEKAMLHYPGETAPVDGRRLTYRQKLKYKRLVSILSADLKQWPKLPK